jgi:hypothetical protein
MSPLPMETAEMVLQGRVVPATPGLAVQLVDAGGLVVAETKVQPGGWFQLGAVPTAVYQLQVIDSSGQIVPLRSEAISQITPGQLLPEYVLELAPAQSEESPAETAVAPEIAPAEPQQPQLTGTITGVVTAADTGDPIQYAYVEAYSSPNVVVTSDYADAAGQYLLTVAAGTYRVRFSRSSSPYAPEWYNNAPTYEDATDVVVYDNMTTPDINAALDEGGRILGTVTSTEWGSPPLANAQVRLYQSREGTSPVAYSYADSSGDYQFQGLASGDYFVKFHAPSNTSYLPEYFQDRETLALADAITVTLGMTQTGVNGTLALGATMSGTVTAEQGGAPIPSTAVYVYTSTTSTAVFNSDYTDSNGQYVIYGLPPGDYYIKFQAQYNSGYLSEYYNNQPSLAEADPITVDYEDVISGIDAALATGGTVSGSITAVQGGIPIQNAYVRLFTDTTDTGSFVGGDYTDASGHYLINGLLADTYYVEIQAPYNSPYVDEFYNNRASLATADPVNVTLGNTTDVDAALETGGALVGMVTAVQGGNPIQSTSVYLYRGPTHEWVDSDFTAADGAYSFMGLPAGNYYLHFSPPYYSDYLGEYYNNKTTLAQADSIAISLNITTTINAALETGGTLVGTVTAEDGGAPIQYTTVYAYNSLTATSYFRADSTDAAGQYEISGLPADSYYLKFAAPGDYVSEFYNNKRNLDTADPIPVALASTVTADAELATGGVIVGQVLAADSQTPLADARVIIYGPAECSDDEYIATRYTDASGTFTITKRYAGVHYISVDAPASAPGNAYLDNYSGAEVTVTPGQTENVTIELERGGQIRGQVTADGSNAPLPDVYVSIYTLIDTGNYTYYSYQGGAFTDASGYYTSTGLATNDYQVRFSPSSVGASASYLQEYYNNKSSLDTADEVAVTMGQMTNNINAALDMGGQISGQVTAADTGDPLDDVYVRVFTSTSSSYSIASVATDANGTYTTTALPAGSYYLEFVPYTWSSISSGYASEYYDNQPLLSQATAVVVTINNITTDIDAALSPGISPVYGRIAGHVTTEEGQDLSSVYVVAYNTNGEYVGNDYTDSDGEYLIDRLPPGTYYVLFNSREYETVSCAYLLHYRGEYYNDKTSFHTADPVQVTGGQVTENIDASLALAPGEPPPPNTSYDIYLPVLLRP